MQSRKSLDQQLGALFQRAEDMEILPRFRSGAMYRLMELAAEHKDVDLWLKIGRLLERAHDVGDLAPSVSDRFVNKCPDEVFRQVANASPRVRFKEWHHRALRLGIPSR
jgi:hypothetical protein